MITGSLVCAYSAQIMILIAAAAVAVKLARVRDARLRLTTYQIVLAACVLLPWIERLMPQVAVSGLVTAGVSTWDAMLGSAPARSQLNISFWIVGVLAAGVAVRLVWIACGLLRLKQL